MPLPNFPTMKTAIIAAFGLLACCGAGAQTAPKTAKTTAAQATGKAYYMGGSDEGVFEPVAAADMASYVDTRFYVEDSLRNGDGTVTVALKTYPDGLPVRREQYRGKTPVGRWMQRYNLQNPPLETIYEVDTSGALASCPTPYIYELGTTELSFGSAAGSFTPPVLADGGDVPSFFNKYLSYPAAAREGNIQGKVRIKGTLTEEGQLTDLAISKSVDRDLDAEVYRVVKLMRFKGPALVNGRPARLCVSMPVDFNLR